VPTLAPEFSQFYQSYELGPVPGMPPGHLGGCVVKFDDPSTLLLAGNSEQPQGGLYAIKLKRDGCGHIIGFEGTATKVASTPYIDANLVYGKDDVLLYSQYPVNQVSQLLPGASEPGKTAALGGMGVDASIGGLGFVPPGLPTAGSLRALSWPGGNWFRLNSSYEGGWYEITAASKVTTLGGGPGGFAYVPKGSKGFPVQSVIVAEWSGDKVGVYEVDGEGEPVVQTRKDFFSSFLKPWGAYFDPISGDYLFLTWNSSPDRVYVVRGFVPPPEKP
jgi:hypothetical protein